MMLNSKVLSPYKISVVVPVYNAQKTIALTLESLLKQTLSEIEIIVINDGSTDNSLAIASRFEKSHPKQIKVITTTNQGAYQARSAGINHAQGEYVGFCDADDTAEPEMFETLYNKIIDCNADMAVCSYYRQENEKILSTEMKYDFPEAKPVDKNAGWLVSVNTATWNKLIRTNLAKQHATLNVSPRIGEDALFLLSIYPHIRSIAFTNKPLYHYYVNNSSAMKAISKEEIHHVIQSWKQARKQINSNDFLYIFDLAAFIHLGVSLPLVLFKSGYERAKDTYSTLLEVLDSAFSKYKRSPFLKINYVLTHRKFMVLPFFASIFTKLKLLAPLLQLYNLLTSFFGKDFKW